MKDNSRGSLAVALAHTTRLLETDPALAAEQAAEILKVAPSDAAATLLLGVAHRMAGTPQSALHTFEPLLLTHPRWSALHYEYAMALSALGCIPEAIEALTRAAALQPSMAVAWRALGDHFLNAGDAKSADAAYAQYIKASTKDPRLLAAAAALCDNDIPRAEMLLRAHLKVSATDVAAIRMFAEVAARLRRYADAEALLIRCLELSPSFMPARHNYAIVLHRQNKSAAALREVDALLATDGRNANYNNLKAAILAKIGEMDGANEVYAGVLADDPQQPMIWMSYGHALKTAGRESESIAAYRRSIELRPGLGEAYWSLANLKTLHFSAADVAAMNVQLENARLPDEDRLHLEFSLGKALEDLQDYAGAFNHYARGNRLRRTQIAYHADETTRHVRRCKSRFTADFFATRSAYGTASADPIFIVGLPRAGSTLVEQILASHSQVEGTMELPDIAAIARSLLDIGARTGVKDYTEVLAELDATGCRELGERYIEQTRIQRKTVKPFFIDKMPNNFTHIHLIQMALPRAKIIDARRHPLGCCFSCFKQHFARGQSFTYSLEDLGAYYRDYEELMAHYDVVLPGRIHRVIYENLVTDTENEVRRLLDHCGLPFEERCLRFYENERAVRTASSQQVRRPIFTSGLDQWRHFESWLGPLKDILGPKLCAYPAVPRF